MKGWLFPVSLTLSLFILIAGCTMNGTTEKIPLKVVAAGSLLTPFSEIEARYETLHPDIDVQVEGHGSIQAIRQVTDLSRPFDVVAVADESLIPDLMYRPSKEIEKNFSESYVPFARNEIVIAYTEKSRYQEQINATNWPDILARPDVRVGFSNPMLDAAGYRALMVTLLARDYYGDPGIFGRVIGDHFDPPFRVEESETHSTVRLPEILHPSGHHVAIRDGSIFLMSLLAAGGIDYAFEYRSVAEAQGFSYLPLPPEINLALPVNADRYEKSRVILGFQRFSSIGQERIGCPIVYAMTVPSNAPYPEEGRKFIQFVIEQGSMGEKGWPNRL